MLGNKSYLYGMDEIVKCWCKYPKWLPFRYEIHHGWYLQDEPTKFDIESYSPVLLMLNKRQRETWVKKHKKPAIIIGSPYIHYRRCKKIKPNPNARGTVVFPQHSAHDSDAGFDIDKYCSELHRLPDRFKPLKICLHIHDVKRGKAALYEKKGFTVTTAGQRDSISFAKNFYNILSNCQYTTSNIVGSHVMYAIELGIPFFLYGDPGNYPGRPEIPKAKIGEKAKALFKVPPEKVKITKKQKKFIESEAGINDCINPEELRKYLIKIFFFKSIPIAFYRILRLPYVALKRIYKFGRKIIT